MKESLKYRIGISEIIGTVIGIAFLTDLPYFLRYLNLVNGYSIYENVAVVIITFFAGLFGAPTGVIMSLVGITISQHIMGHRDIAFVIAIIIYGFIVGHFAKKYGVRDGRFNNKRAIVLFNCVQIIGNIFAGVYIMPILSLFVGKVSLEDTLDISIKQAIILVFVIGIFITSIYSGISFIYGKLKK